MESFLKGRPTLSSSEKNFETKTQEVKSITPQKDPSEATPSPNEQAQEAPKIEYVLESGIVKKILITCKCGCYTEIACVYNEIKPITKN